MSNGKPNMLVIRGDDIRITNLSWYSDGQEGYRTPTIDGIAAEPASFTVTGAVQKLANRLETIGGCGR